MVTNDSMVKADRMITTGRIKWPEKVGYGLGDAASSMFWKIFSMYLLFFYTDVFGISAAAAGTMFLVTRIWDSCFDPVVGIIADRTHSRWGKFRPWLLWVAAPFGVVGILTFYTPALGAGGKLVYAYVTYSLMMMVYSLINVPYASLLGVMSTDGKERTELSSYRMVFAFAGSLLALWWIEPLVRYFGHGELGAPGGWLKTVGVFSIMTTLLFWGCFRLTRERVRPRVDSAARKNSVKDRGSLKQDLRDLFSNRPWWILLGAAVTTLVFNAIRDGGAIYYFKYYAGNEHWTTLYLVLGQASNILGVVLATPVAGRYGKKSTYLAAMMLATVLSVVFYFFGRTDVVGIMIFQCLISICAGSIFPLLWSMYADIADFSEWKKGRRATGLIFSSSSMAQKFGWTIGGATTGWLLGYFGFQANTVQSGATQESIRWMLSFFPAAGSLLSAVFIFLYPLNEKMLSEINHDLYGKSFDDR